MYVVSGLCNNYRDTKVLLFEYLNAYDSNQRCGVGTQNFQLQLLSF
jgi:hypothetical protein